MGELIWHPKKDGQTVTQLLQGVRNEDRSMTAGDHRTGRHTPNAINSRLGCIEGR
jgi:hypothetical protein